MTAAVQIPANKLLLEPRTNDLQFVPIRGHNPRLSVQIRFVDSVLLLYKSFVFSLVESYSAEKIVYLAVLFRNYRALTST